MALFFSVLRFALALFLSVSAAGSLVGIVFRTQQGFRERFLLQVTFSVLIISLVTAICGLIHCLDSFSILLSTALVFIVFRFRTEQSTGPKRGHLKYIPFVLLVPFAVNLFFISAFVLLPPVDWDAMTYHLYIPCRWIRDGACFHVPTVFGDNAAAFAPKLFSLICAWTMILHESDILTNCLSVLFLATAALYIYGICIQCGSGRRPALLASSLSACTPALCFRTFTATPDTAMLAFLLGGFYWFLKSMRKDTSYAQSCCCAAGIISCGMAAGMKTVGLFFGFPIILLLTIQMILRKRPGILILSPFLFVAAGAWFYVINLILYKNPLFPLDISFTGIRLFKGAYNSDAIRAGEFYTDSIPELLKNLVSSWGLPLCIVFAAGTLFLPAAAVIFRKKNLFVLLFVFLFWVLGYFYVIPHNLQTRFLFPGLALSFTGLSFVFRLLKKRNLQYLFFSIPVLFFVFESASGLIPDYAILPISPLLMIIVCFIVGGLLFLSSIKINKNRNFSLIMAGVFLMLCIFVALQSAPAVRCAALKRSDFAGWADSFIPFNGSRPTVPLTIAYTGFNLPYVFVGPYLKNRIVYCNVSGRQTDNFFDFWKQKQPPSLFKYHKPGLYRKNPDYKIWLGNLEKSGAELLAVMEMHPYERCYLETDSKGFPVEAKWASEHPEKFRLVHEGRHGKIFLIPGNR